MLAWFGSYLVIVFQENRREEDAPVTKVNTVTVYDTRNKFIAFTASFKDVVHVLSEWNTLYILTGDGLVSRCI